MISSKLKAKALVKKKINSIKPTLKEKSKARVA